MGNKRIDNALQLSEPKFKKKSVEFKHHRRKFLQDDLLFPPIL